MEQDFDIFYHSRNFWRAYYYKTVSEYADHTYRKWLWAAGRRYHESSDGKRNCQIIEYKCSATCK